MIIAQTDRFHVQSSKVTNVENAKFTDQDSQNPTLPLDENALEER